MEAYSGYNARKRAVSNHPGLHDVHGPMEAAPLDRMVSLHPSHRAMMSGDGNQVNHSDDLNEMQAMMQQMAGILSTFMKSQHTPSPPGDKPDKPVYDRQKSVAPTDNRPKLLMEDEEGRKQFKAALAAPIGALDDDADNEEDYISVLPPPSSKSKRPSPKSKIASMSLQQEQSHLDMNIISEAEVAKNLRAVRDSVKNGQKSAKRPMRPGQHGAGKPNRITERRKRMSSFSQKHAHRLSRRRSILPNTVNMIEYRKRQYHLDPFSFGRLSWEWCIFAVSLMHVIMAPLYFGWNYLFIHQLSYALVLVFVIDWFVQALTSYMKTDGKNFGLWEKEPATLIKFYLREYFVIDFFIAFPLAPIILQHIDEESIWSILSLLDIIKIIRVKRAFCRFKRGTLTNPSLWKLIILWLILLYIWHLYACIYWLIEKHLGLDETTMGPPIEFRDVHFFIEYSWAVFWVVSVNAGSATYPEKPIEALFACFTVVTGVLVVAGVISTTNNAVREYDTLEQRRTRRLREILQYLRNRNTTPKLIREVLEYYQYCFQNNIGEESGADLLNELPTILRERLIKTFYKPIIEKIPLFDDLPKVVLDDLVLTLERRIYVPGEYLIIKGEIGREMYIISYGRIRVELGQHCIYLGEGDYLGEQALLTSAKRNASAFCESHCELLVLRRSLFIELCSYYEDLPLHILQRSPQYMNSKEKARLALKENVCQSFGIMMQ